MTRLGDAEARYYAAHSRMTDPGDRASLLDALPSDPSRLVAAVSGLVLHPLFVGPLGVTPAPDSAEDVESRTLQRMLDRVLARDPAPLDAARPPERRFIGRRRAGCRTSECRAPGSSRPASRGTWPR